MSSADHALSFLTTLQTQFRVKRHESDEHEAKWVEMMVAELKGYSAEVLEQAAKNMIRKRRNEFFPVLSECLAACDDAKHWIDQANPRFKLQAAKASPGTNERRRLADELIMGEMGRQAAREGWIVGLHDFIRDNQRLPDAGQVRKLKSAADGIPHDLDTCLAGMSRAPEKLDGRGGSFRQIDGRDLSAALRDLGISMLARREKLTDMVLHGVVR